MCFFVESSFDIGFKRASRQFGIMLTKDLEHLDSGIGPGLNVAADSDYRIVNATKTFDKQATFNAAGGLICILLLIEY